MLRESLLGLVWRLQGRTDGNPGHEAVGKIAVLLTDHFQDGAVLALGLQGDLEARIVAHPYYDIINSGKGLIELDGYLGQCISSKHERSHSELLQLRLSSYAAYWSKVQVFCRDSTLSQLLSGNRSIGNMCSCDGSLCDFVPSD